MIHKIAKASLFLIGLLAAYLGTIWNQPRMADGQLEFDEAYLIDIVVIMTAVCSVALTWLLTLKTALKSKNWFWAIGMFLAWPLCYVYLLWIKRSSDEC